jgi:hypothetical protein
MTNVIVPQPQLLPPRVNILYVFTPDVNVRDRAYSTVVFAASCLFRPHTSGLGSLIT